MLVGLRRLHATQSSLLRIGLENQMKDQHSETFELRIPEWFLQVHCGTIAVGWCQRLLEIYFDCLINLSFVQHPSTCQSLTSIPLHCVKCYKAWVEKFTSDKTDVMCACIDERERESRSRKKNKEKVKSEQRKFEISFKQQQKINRKLCEEEKNGRLKQGGVSRPREEQGGSIYNYHLSKQ